MKWKVDPAHSEVGFKVKHMMFTTVSGRFDKYDATVTMDGDNLETAQAEFSADIASINTANDERDKHLRSADFFNADTNPKLTFRSTSIRKVGDDYEMTGDLTMNGITKPVTVKVEYSGKMTDPWGNPKIGLNIDGKIKRSDWGLNWNSMLETGGVLVSDEVRLNIEVQLVEDK